MERIATALFAVIAAATPAFASGADSGETGIFIRLFLGFMALLIVSQVVPALMLLCAIVRGALAMAGAPREAAGCGPGGK